MRTSTREILSIFALTAAIAVVRFFSGVSLSDLGLPRLFADTDASPSAARFEPRSAATVEEMLKLAAVNRNDIVYDLGCGDGRIVITAARSTGARGIGVDNNAELILTSRRNASSADVSDLVQFRQEDLFSADVSDATVVMLYLSPDANLKLRPKLLKELKPGSRIVSHSHDMGDWRPDRRSQAENHEIYFWTVPADASGRWKLDVSDKYAGDYILEIEQNFQQIEARAATAGRTCPVSGAVLNGKKIDFRIERELGSLGPTAEFSGEVEGEAISGTFRSKHHSGRWRAVRVRAKS